MLIFRRSNLIVTASGIVALRKQLFSAPVESGVQGPKNIKTRVFVPSVQLLLNVTGPVLSISRFLYFA